MNSILLLALLTGNTISNPTGKSFGICGKGSKAATNAYLVANGQRFVADYPASFPSTYWGINKATDSYICLRVTSFPNSTWTQTSPAATYNTAFDQFVVTIYGYRTNAAGVKIDVSGNGTVGDEEFIGLDLSMMTDGLTPAMTTNLNNFWINTFGVGGWNPSPAVGLESGDSAGYPNSAGIGSIFDPKFVGAMSTNNQYACSPRAQTANCVYYGAFSGTEYRAQRGPAHTNGTFTFSHNGNNWVKFDSATDLYFTSGPLNTMMSSLGFTPTFITRAKATSWSY